MSLKLKLKHCVERLPPAFSKPLVYVPFEWRLGRQYSESKDEFKRFESENPDQVREMAFERIRAITCFAQENIDFYRAFYGDHGFRHTELQTFADIERIPILTKADLKEWPLDQRSSFAKGSLKVNTGGTSGEPLEFYLDRHAFAREWAHMHAIWQQLDYKRTDCKLTFRGKILGTQVLRYNAVHNEYMTNAYCGHEKLATQLRTLLKRESIRFLHGYPSSIFSFAEYCNSHAEDVAELLRGSLKGILFGSEFPAPHYREVIENTFKAPTLSWYGHSEMAILAHENKESSFIYNTMPSYGYAEAVPTADGEFRLVGTSYYNQASPFIRYDTGDLIAPETMDDGLLRSFRIASGRQGEFVEDCEGNRISLTALIFGRHHSAFASVKFVQVHQPCPGKMILRVTLKEGEKDRTQATVLEGFDFSHVNLEIDCIVADEPILTRSGKVSLLLKEL